MLLQVCSTVCQREISKNAESRKVPSEARPGRGLRCVTWVRRDTSKQCVHAELRRCRPGAGLIMPLMEGITRGAWLSRLLDLGLRLQVQCFGSKFCDRTQAHRPHPADWRFYPPMMRPSNAAKLPFHRLRFPRERFWGSFWQPRELRGLLRGAIVEPGSNSRSIFPKPLLQRNFARLLKCVASGAVTSC